MKPSFLAPLHIMDTIFGSFKLMHTDEIRSTVIITKKHPYMIVMIHKNRTSFLDCFIGLKKRNSCAQNMSQMKFDDPFKFWPLFAI